MGQSAQNALGQQHISEFGRSADIKVLVDNVSSKEKRRQKQLSQLFMAQQQAANSSHHRSVKWKHKEERWEERYRKEKVGSTYIYIQRKIRKSKQGVKKDRKSRGKYTVMLKQNQIKASLFNRGLFLWFKEHEYTRS